MAVLGYLTGKVYYPIDYPIGKILLYILEIIILVFFVGSLNKWVHSTALLYILKSFLILVFMGQVWMMEGKYLLRK